MKINMMCGQRNFGKEWYHVDMVMHNHVTDRDIHLRSFPTSSVGLIYCSHGIAYFTMQEAIALLQSWRRVLKKDGTIHIATPNWDVLRKMAVPMLGPLYGKMGEPAIYHKTVYTPESLRSLLMTVGFKKVRRYDHTLTDHAQYDDHSAAYSNGRLISLNMEATA